MRKIYVFIIISLLLGCKKDDDVNKIFNVNRLNEDIKESIGVDIKLYRNELERSFDINFINDSVLVNDSIFVDLKPLKKVLNSLNNFPFEEDFVNEKILGALNKSIINESCSEQDSLCNFRNKVKILFENSFGQDRTVFSLMKFNSMIFELNELNYLSKDELYTLLILDWILLKVNEMH